MDNVVIHKSKIVRQTIEESGNHLLYSVQYHPETNAVEVFFSQLKHYIKNMVGVINIYFIHCCFPSKQSYQTTY
jgi:GMP synthase-like glutamine amidotransferase